MSGAGAPYDAAFYARHGEGARRSARVLLPMVFELVRPSSVVDVGCGVGSWLAVARELGADDVLGVDGHEVAEDLLEIPAERFRRHDLTRPWSPGRRFDLAMSLEVGEHLPEAAAEVLVESLVALAPVVLFSAAAPHQGGAEHVNEQWPAWWAERFGRHRYAALDCLRWRLLGDERVEWWYQQNALLFVEASRLAASPPLARAHETWGGRCPALVHPTRFLEWVEWGIAESKQRW